MLQFYDYSGLSLDQALEFQKEQRRQGKFFCIRKEAGKRRKAYYLLPVNPCNYVEGYPDVRSTNQKSAPLDFIRNGA